MDERKASPFWTFSLALYRRDGIPPACLVLQDRHGVDVNVMLYGLWLAARGRALTASDMSDVIAAVSPWKDQVVAPLRGVRRILREPAQAAGPSAHAFDSAAALHLREKIKAVELEAERLQQEALYALGQAAGRGEGAAEPLAAAAGNLAAYAAALGAEFDPAACKALLDGFAALNGSHAA